ncbi:hypothetical protein SRHO_G00140220 [Serrasalmus rhombeus]
MNLQHHLLLLLLMTFHLSFAMGGRAQRRQREAEELLKPYLGRVDPASTAVYFFNTGQRIRVSAQQKDALYITTETEQSR